MYFHDYCRRVEIVRLNHKPISTVTILGRSAGVARLVRYSNSSTRFVPLYIARSASARNLNLLEDSEEEERL